MNIIEFDRWNPSPDNPRKLVYAGQRTGQEVFEELKHRLEGQGYLPDEYFDLRTEWENGREIPRDADLFCTVDYGASEGVYVDVYLKWYDQEQKKSITSSFIVGKTLGENGNDLDRMFLTASAITKAVHGDNATHTRYMKVNGQDDTGGRVVHLSLQEEKVIIDALLEQRERQENAMSQTEQLLRRMTGSVTAYMDTVGQRPLRLSDYDRAILAIRDGEMPAFKELCPKVLAEHTDELLLEAAGRPGDVGGRMMALVLSHDVRFSEEVYRTACQKAIDIADGARARLLLAAADHYVAELSPSFHGEVACYAYRDQAWIAREIVEGCSAEQIAAAPSDLLTYALRLNDHPTAWKLAEGGIHVDTCFADIAAICQAKGQERMMVDLLQQGAKVSPGNFYALHACIQSECSELGKLLLDQGMNLDHYKEWVVNQNYGLRCNDTLTALEEHWNELQGQEQEQEQEQEITGPEMGGMNLG